MLTNRWNWRGKGQLREGGSQVREEPKKLGAKEAMSEGQQAREDERAVSDELWDARREAAQRKSRGTATVT